MVSEMSVNQSVEKKPTVVDPDRIELKVTGQDGMNLKDDGLCMAFKLLRVSPLSTLMNAYSKQRAVDDNTYAFLYDGKRLNARETPHQLKMEDGDEIAAMLHMTAG